MQFGRKAFLRHSIACTGLFLALAGCKQVPDLPAVVSPYKIDVQQGNVITQEMLSKLKAGMTRSQVRFVLGSPLVVDPFRLDRWDYVSMYQKQGKEVERRRVTVIFDEDKLIRIEGDVTLADTALSPENAPDKAPPKAAPAEPVKPVPAVKPSAAAPVPANTEVAKPPVAAVPKAEPAKPVAVPAEKVQSPAAVAPAPKESVTDGPAADAGKGSAPTAAADEKKAEPAQKDAPKEKPKSGFFGRMLDKLGI
jgi:outer membrane protein assembly factor BamE